MVSPGDVLTYEVTITSDATVDLDGVTIVDDLAAVLDDATFVAGSAQLATGTGAPASIADPVGDELTAGPFTLPAGGTATVTYRVTVADDAWSRTLTNSVTGTAGEPGDPIEPEPCSDECTTTQVTPTPVQIQKVGEASTGSVVPMDGSEWVIWDAATGGTAVVDPVPAAESGGSIVTGLFHDDSLPAGSYWLEETRALDGFALLSERVPFTIAADGSVTLGPNVSSNVTLIEVDGVATIRVEDVPVLDLPEAGGPGRTVLYAAGLILLISGVVAGVLILARQRRSAAQQREPRA
jgi:hypothetical protein